jgi:hypothetical protein
MRAERVLSYAGVMGVCAVALAANAALGAAIAPGDGARLAYIDPGSGSFILQALVAAVAGAAVAISAYWRKVKQFLGIGPPAAGDEDADPQQRDG